MEDIVFNSHDLFFRQPFGAVTCQETVTLRLLISPAAPVDSVRLKIWGTSTAEQEKYLTIQKSDETETIYQVEVMTPPQPDLLWFYFIITRNGQTCYYGNNERLWGGLGQIYSHQPPAYQITVYQKSFETPEWLKNTVVYQIFVDRFFNGCPQGQFLNPKENVLYHGCWSDRPIYLRDTEKNRIIRWDFFGGNLAGVRQKLTYLKELGIGAIYFNPIFEGASNHKYDTGDYLKIDPMYGTNQEFGLLCQEAAQMGIAIILDGVFSHTGSDSVYFNKEAKYPGVGAFQSKASPYFKWYRFREHPHKYESWWGIDDLPNVNELEPSYQDFIFRGEHSVIKQWMNMGVKGWRLDVADELPDEFLKKMRETIKALDHEGVLIGEVWEDASHKISYGEQREFLWGEELDGVLNYPFRSLAIDYLMARIPAEEINHGLLSLYENYPLPSLYISWNLLGSHDVPRILTVLGEGAPENFLPAEHKEEYQLSPTQRELAIRRLKMLTVLQMTYPGVPCIYYGDEAGLEGLGDPYNRATYPWGHEEGELLAWYKKIISLRQAHPVLREGKWRPLIAADDCYVYLRQDSVNTAVIMFNRSQTEQRQLFLELESWFSGKLVDALSVSEPVEQGTKIWNVTLPPLTAQVYLSEKAED